MRWSIRVSRSHSAAARKLTRAIWAVLKNGAPYQDQDEELTERKEKRMVRKVEDAPRSVTPDDLEVLVDRLTDKTNVLERLAQEVPDAG